MSAQQNGHEEEEDDVASDEEEEEEEDGDEEEDSSEEEEDSEPQLKYQRLSGSLSKIFSTDNGNFASAMAVSDKFLALGTHLGYVYILDFEGHTNQQHIFRPHTGSVNDLSIDEYGEYIASCSNDGKVVVYNLYGSDRYEFNYNRPIKSVAIDPEFKVRTERPVVSGGKTGKLVLSKKGWFGHKETVIHKGEGDIHAVRWHGNYIAWANDQGVKIFDVVKNEKITYLERSKNAPRPDMFRCCLHWVTNKDTTKQPFLPNINPHLPKLIIAWGTQICVMQIVQSRVEILSMFDTSFYICGVSPYADGLLCLSYVGEFHGKGTAPRPELRIMNLKGEELACDQLTIKNFQHYFATDYRLEYCAEDNVYYILSQKDIVIAKPRDVEDHIKWLIEHERYDDALKRARENESKLVSTSVLAIGKEYLGYLLKTKQYKEAAQLVGKVSGDSKELWEEWIYAFIDQKQFKVIIPHIPINNPRLSDTIYEMKLNFFLKNSPEQFLQAVREWPHDIYKAQHVIMAVSEQLKTENNDTLLNALAQLYINERQYDRALNIYFKLRRPDVFEFIQEHDLFSSVQDKISLLLEFDEKRALDLLINKTDENMIDQVVKQLIAKRRELHLYLDALFDQNVRASQKYHLLQVELYSDFETEKLVGFLEQSQSYNIERALHICEERADNLEKVPQKTAEEEEKLKMLYRGIVYLLGRMGNTNDALHLIIDKLQDVDLAISFVEKQRDSELWQDLINYSLNNAKFIEGLLDHIADYIADHIDPLSLIKKIPRKMEIAGLKYKLANIIGDYSLQMTLQRGCQDILAADTKELSQELYREQRKGVRIVQGKKCVVCAIPLRNTREDDVIFMCGHSYHATCLRQVAQIPESATDLSKMKGRLRCVLCHQKDAETGKVKKKETRDR